MPTQYTKVLIIGSGPAGYTAAVYAARANLKPVLIQGLVPGGQLMITTDVENYPGFPDGVLGPEMMDKFEAQARRFGTELRYGMVTKIHTEQRPFRCEIDEDPEDVVLADAVIVATGADAKWLGIPDEERFRGHGVTACATCDGAFFKNQDVCIVGGGDTAMEEANYLTRMCRSVHVIHRRDSLRASKVMQDRCRANPKISFHWNRAVDGIEGDPHGGITGVRLIDTNTGATEVHAWTGVFVAIGHKPNSDLFAGILDMDDAGYIHVRPGTTYTNVPGVFACGDVADHVYRQAVTAAGTGCMAAIDAERWLEAQAAPE